MHEPLSHSYLPSEALAHQRSVRHGVRASSRRRKGKLVGAVETTSGPANIAEEDIGVLVEVAELLAHVLLARLCVAASGLGEHGLALVIPKPLGKGCEGVVDVVGCALGVCA